MQDAWIYGAGRSGLSAARFLLARGWGVTLFDAKDSPDLRTQLASLDASRTRFELGPTAQPADAATDTHPTLCVVSPGVPAESPWIATARQRGATVISELELGVRHLGCPVVAITGSKGKSTLAKLCHDSLRAAGKRVAIGGNYGTPVCDLVEESNTLDWLVLEVSSFQLEHVATFSPRVAVLLNIQPDHLDRHGSMEVYAAVKARLFARMSDGATAILPAGEIDIRQKVPDCRARVCTFGADSNDSYHHGTHAVQGPDGPILDISGSYFDNPVLGMTAAAALAVMDACGVDHASFRRSLLAFESLPHRMSRVGEMGGVTYINDSKATSLSALAAGVRMAPGPVHLLAGGLLKEYNLELPKQVLAKHVRAVYVFGKFSVTLKAAWQDTVRCIRCETLEEATRLAASHATPGEVVLLSPGCASFDQFQNFEDRGNQFVRIVQTLMHERMEN